MKKPFTNLLALSASLGWLSLSAGPNLQAQCVPFGFEAKLSSPVQANLTKYGTAVAADGDTIVVGAPGAGAAYVQSRDGSLVATLRPPSGTAVDFGSRVAISRHFVAVADPLKDSLRGAVYLYRRINYDADPICLTGGAGSSFGSGLALEDTTLVVGAWGERKAHVYDYANDVWSANLEPVGPSTGGLGDPMFGLSVAISGDRIAVGAPKTTKLAPPSLTESGAVYIFERVNGAWSRTNEIVGTVAQQDFGYSVALEGDTLVVGAPNPYSASGGVAYTFTLSADPPSDPFVLPRTGASGDQFGASVALRGNYILVGSPGTPGTCAGAATVFQRLFSSANTWVNAQTFGPEDVGFGTSVALGSGFVAVGSPQTSSSPYIEVGATYVYSFPLVLADEKVTVHYHDQNAPGATTDSSGYSKADIRGDIGFSVPGVVPAPQAHVMAWLGSQLIASAPVLFDVGGNNGDKWEAKPASGPVEKFKIHWYEAVEFDAVQSNPASPKIKSKFIGLTETELRYEAKAGTYQTTFPAHGVTVNVVSGKITAVSGATASEIESDKKAADITLGSRLVPGEQIITTGGITDTITVTAGVNLQSAQGKFELKLRQDAAFAQPLFTAGTSLRYEIVLGTDMGACAAGGASVIGVEPKPWDADDNNHKRYHEDTSD